jgi:hypothetical protein
VQRIDKLYKDSFSGLSLLFQWLLSQPKIIPVLVSEESLMMVIDLADHAQKEHDLQVLNLVWKFMTSFLPHIKNQEKESIFVEMVLNALCEHAMTLMMTTLQVKNDSLIKRFLSIAKFYLGHLNAIAKCFPCSEASIPGIATWLLFCS